MRKLALALFTAIAVGGCTGTLQGSSHGTYATGSYDPELVYAGPGVQVIADYEQPVFYSDNLYWRYDRGSWYRSPYYNRGWVSISTPPVRVSRIQRPMSYRYYRPSGYVRRDTYRGRWREPDRANRQNRPVVRDRRR